MNPRYSSVPELLARAAVIGLSLRLAAVFSLYSTGTAGYGRHHVEAAAVWFVGALAIAFAMAAARDRLMPASPAAASNIGTFRAGHWALFALASLVLYAPVLRIGLLSDDFGLVALADAWRVGPVTSTLFRPVPLISWAVLLDLHAPPAVFHGLNAGLHGTAAYLIVLILRAWLGPSPWTWVGGALALASPIAVEPVAWLSGIFDLSAATCVLAAVVATREYDGTARPIWRVRGWLVVAMLCKETAFVGPVLVLTAAGARGAIPRRLLRDGALLTVIGMAYALARAWLSDTSLPIDRYVVQRTLFSDLGTRALPFHQTVTAAHPWMPLAFGMIVIALLTCAAILRSRLDIRRAMAGGTAWIVVALAAVFPVLPVAGDLQGSRYLYLGQLGWSAIIAGACAAVAATPAAWIARGAATLVLVASCAAVFTHERAWIGAADLRAHILASVADSLRASPCPAVALRDLPDAVEGAYLFRNSAPEAFARTINVRVGVDAATPGCTFRWWAGERVMRRE